MISPPFKYSARRVLPRSAKLGAPRSMVGASRSSTCGHLRVHDVNKGVNSRARRTLRAAMQQQVEPHARPELMLDGHRLEERCMRAPSVRWSRCSRSRRVPRPASARTKAGVRVGCRPAARWPPSSHIACTKLPGPPKRRVARAREAETREGCHDRRRVWQRQVSACAAALAVGCSSRGALRLPRVGCPELADSRL